MQFGRNLILRVYYGDEYEKEWKTSYIYLGMYGRGHLLNPEDYKKHLMYIVCFGGFSEYYHFDQQREAEKAITNRYYLEKKIERDKKLAEIRKRMLANVREIQEELALKKEKEERELSLQKKTEEKEEKELSLHKENEEKKKRIDTN